MKYDTNDLPGEIADLPTCSTCLDEGILEIGSDVRSTNFCDCDLGEETFIAWADAESAAPYADDRDWDDSPSGGDYWRNEDGEWSCG